MTSKRPLTLEQALLLTEAVEAIIQDAYMFSPPERLNIDWKLMAIFCSHLCSCEWNLEFNDLIVFRLLYYIVVSASTMIIYEDTPISVF